jgi:hypothetical protein
MTPRPPALVTAAASSLPAATFMPASRMGCLIPNNLVRGVEIVGVLMVERCGREGRCVGPLAWYYMRVTAVHKAFNHRLFNCRIRWVSEKNVQYSQSTLSFFSFCTGQLYSRVPTATNPPPAKSDTDQPLPNQTILTIKLTALRAVSRRLVFTEELVYTVSKTISKITRPDQGSSYAYRY